MIFGHKDNIEKTLLLDYDLLVHIFITEVTQRGLIQRNVLIRFHLFRKSQLITALATANLLIGLLIFLFAEYGLDHQKT